jgi:hypothetical protein
MVKLFGFLLTPRDRRSLPIVSQSGLNLELYEFGLTREFLGRVQHDYHGNFARLLMELYDGTFFAEGYAPSREDADQGRIVVLALAEYLCSRPDALPPHMPEAKLAREELVARLALDGISLVGKRLIPSESATVDQPREVTLLQEVVKQSALPHEKVILEHYQQGEELFAGQKWGPAISQWRNFFEALLRDIAEITVQNRPEPKKGVGPMKNLFNYLKDVGFFDEDERGIMGAVYGFLCQGSHPGIPQAHEARYAMVLSLTFGQILATKYVAWRQHSFRGF